MLPGCKQTTPAHTMWKYGLPKVNCPHVALRSPSPWSERINQGIKESRDCGLKQYWWDHGNMEHKNKLVEQQVWKYVSEHMFCHYVLALIISDTTKLSITCSKCSDRGERRQNQMRSALPPSLPTSLPPWPHRRFFPLRPLYAIPNIWTLAGSG